MIRRPFVYLAGPISKGNHPTNIRNGIDAGRKLSKAGYVVFIPMLDFLTALVYPEIDYEEYLDSDFQIISRCDAVFRIAGESPGADREEKFAALMNIPVFKNLQDLDKWKNTIYGKEERCHF